MERLTLKLVFALVALSAVTLVTGAVTIARAQASAPSQAKYEFTLGFKSLAGLIPDVVGDPLENEHYGASGDSLQQTTGGLMAWRKADNWTGFTDGARSWINGPLGLQERSNNERFDWERQATVDATQVSLFRPAGVRGPDQEGYCWTESLSSWQPDAWRCMVANRIYDPCFGTSTADNPVICGASPQGDASGFRLKLTQPLPARKAPPAGTHAWMLELADGVTCGFLTGASTGVEGERANYGCTDGWYILGEPQPDAVWTARQARIEVSRQGPALMDSARVAIRRVWQ